MIGGNSNNHMLPVYLDENALQFNSNAANPQLQLFGNLPAGCTLDPVNYFGNEQNPSIFPPNKRAKGTEDGTRHQKVQISLNQEVGCNLNPNPVSTGLRLSYDDDERNSTVTSSSGSMAGTPSILLSLDDNIRSEIERQKEEFDHYIKIQEEQLCKGLRDMKQRQLSMFLTTMEKAISKKLHEKELELESLNRTNRELTERIKQVATEAQNWHYRAKYNESLVNVLKNNLQQAISRGFDHGKEGFGDSEVDDAASLYVDPSNLLAGAGKPVLRGSKERVICKACRSREVSILLMPCRHLCVCKECDMALSVCPVCNSVKTASVEVYLS